LFSNYPNFTTGNELYISFYYRHTKTSANWGRQSKAWIAYPDVGTDRAYWTNSMGTCQVPDSWRTHRTEDADENFPGLGAQEIDNEWVRFESYLKQSAAETANGAWHQTTYRPTLVTPEKSVVTLDDYKMRDTSDDWIWWVFGGAYWSGCDGDDSLDVDVDEFVMDSQRARVEIANTSTWAARTISEYQVATAWADGEITCTLNAGHHGDTDTVYLYVIDSDGTVNANGFEITLGAAGEPPATPLRGSGLGGMG
jgi:hypothetical protein